MSQNDYKIKTVRHALKQATEAYIINKEIIIELINQLQPDNIDKDVIETINNALSEKKDDVKSLIDLKTKIEKKADKSNQLKQIYDIDGYLIKNKVDKKLQLLSSEFDYQKYSTGADKSTKDNINEIYTNIGFSNATSIKNNLIMAIDSLKNYKNRINDEKKHIESIQNELAKEIESQKHVDEKRIEQQENKSVEQEKEKKIGFLKKLFGGNASIEVKKSKEVVEIENQLTSLENQIYQQENEISNCTTDLINLYKKNKEIEAKITAMRLSNASPKLYEAKDLSKEIDINLLPDEYRTKIVNEYNQNLLEIDEVKNFIEKYNLENKIFQEELPKAELKDQEGNSKLYEEVITQRNNSYMGPEHMSDIARGEKDPTTNDYFITYEAIQSRIKQNFTELGIVGNADKIETNFNNNVKKEFDKLQTLANQRYEKQEKEKKEASEKLRQEMLSNPEYNELFSIKNEIKEKREKLSELDKTKEVLTNRRNRTAQNLANIKQMEFDKVFSTYERGESVSEEEYNRRIIENEEAEKLGAEFDEGEAKHAGR